MDEKKLGISGLGRGFNSKMSKSRPWNKTQNRDLGVKKRPKRKKIKFVRSGPEWASCQNDTVIGHHFRRIEKK